MTPTWLEAHASYIDSSRTATAKQLTFNACAVQNAALLKVPMIHAGVLKVGTPLTVEITVAHDVSIGKVPDSDIRYGVSDGTRFIGFQTCDKGQVYPLCKVAPSPPNPATLSTPVSLSSLSSWMNAGARATLRMTAAS